MKKEFTSIVLNGRQRTDYPLIGMEERKKSKIQMTSTIVYPIHMTGCAKYFMGRHRKDPSEWIWDLDPTWQWRLLLPSQRDKVELQIIFNDQNDFVIALLQTP